jgi:hypothetical protein
MIAEQLVADLLVDGDDGRGGAQAVTLQPSVEPLGPGRS